MIRTDESEREGTDKIPVPETEHATLPGTPATPACLGAAAKSESVNAPTPQVEEEVELPGLSVSARAQASATVAPPAPPHMQTPQPRAPDMPQVQGEGEWLPEIDPSASGPGARLVAAAPHARAVPCVSPPDGQTSAAFPSPDTPSPYPDTLPYPDTRTAPAVSAAPATQGHGRTARGEARGGVRHGDAEEAGRVEARRVGQEAAPMEQADKDAEMRPYHSQPVAEVVDRERWKEEMSRCLADFRLLACKRSPFSAGCAQS